MLTSLEGIDMIRIEFKHEGVAATLAKAASQLDDMTPLHEAIGEYVIDITKERFKKGIAPDGTAWTPKSPVTLAA